MPLDQSQGEGRLLLAKSAYESGQVTSIRAAARTYDVKSMTLRARLKGRPSRDITRANGHKLTATEENALLQWITALDQRDLPPRAALVGQMANTLLSKREGDNTQRIGQHWVQNFIKRHPDLKSRYLRKYNYQRAQCEDPVVIKQWFERVKAMTQEFGIQSQDIYSFDETGFAMGVISTAKVISTFQKRPNNTLPGNRECITVIECINANGFSIPPMIIFKGKLHQSAWYTYLPDD